MPLRLVVAVETRHKQSIGTILRCSSALGASLVVLVGASKFGTHGSHGAQTRIEIVHFFYWVEALQYLRISGDKVLLYGIASNGAAKSMIESTDVSGYDFENVDCTDHRTTTVFVVGNKETGLSATVLPLLEAVFHTDVPNPQFYERLHSDAILSICLHRYLVSSKASLEFRRIDEAEAEKFSLDAPRANWRAHTGQKRCGKSVPLLEKGDEEGGEEAGGEEDQQGIWGIFSSRV